MPIDTDQRRQMFLVFKEAMHNAVRHSRCTEIHVDFGLEAQHLVLQVTDNGAGFYADGATEGHGLTSMRPRASDRWRLQVTSQPGQGDRLLRDFAGQPHHWTRKAR